MLIRNSSNSMNRRYVQTHFRNAVRSEAESQRAANTERRLLLEAPFVPDQNYCQPSLRRRRKGQRFMQGRFRRSADEHFPKRAGSGAVVSRGNSVTRNWLRLRFPWYLYQGCQIYGMDLEQLETLGVT